MKQIKKPTLDSLLKISTGNESLKFLHERFNSKKYRGIQIFQHNRYDHTKFYSMLEVIKNIFVESGLEKIEIPNGDENNGKNNGFNLADYKEYELIVQGIKNTCGIGTANTIKKNYFPDWESANVIKRYHERKNKTYFCLNKKILSKSRHEWEKEDLYKSFVAKKVEKYIEPIYELLKEFKYIEYHEFLFFFTYYDFFYKDYLPNFSGCPISIIKDLIYSWRKLSKINKKNTIEIIKNFMDPKLYKNLSKDKKKDWGNFNNETHEILSKLKYAKLFKIDEKDRKIDLNCCSKDNNANKFKRDVSIINDYHKKHHTEKTKGYEMDHIVKFSLATTFEDIPYIDSYLNLLYIDGKSHAIKTSSNSNHIILKSCDNGSKIKLSHINSDEEDIILEIGDNVLFNIDLINDYLEHNEKTIDFVINKNKTLNFLD